MEAVDKQTLELRAKIDQMLASSGPDFGYTNSMNEIFTQISEKPTQAPLIHEKLDGLRMRDFRREQPPVNDEKKEVQAEVQSIIRNCLQVEDQAYLIKNRGNPAVKR